MSDQPYPAGAYCLIERIINTNRYPVFYWRPAISEKTLTPTRPHPWAFEQGEGS